MESLLVVAHSGFHQQAGYAILHLDHLPHEQMPIAQRSAAPSLGCRHVALRQEIAPQAVRDLAGIDAVILLLGRGDRAQHRGGEQPSPQLHVASEDRRSNR